MSIQDLLAFAAGVKFAIDTLKMVCIDAKLSARTALPRGEEWLAVHGFRYSDHDKTPLCWTEYYIHRDFAVVGRVLQHHSGPIFPLIEDLFGQTVVEVHQEIAAAVVSAALADAFAVDPASAVLEVRRTYTISSGQVAQITINTHPAERFRHSMTMRRVKV